MVNLIFRNLFTYLIIINTIFILDFFLNVEMFQTIWPETTFLYITEKKELKLNKNVWATCAIRSATYLFLSCKFVWFYFNDTYGDFEIVTL